MARFGFFPIIFFLFLTVFVNGQEQKYYGDIDVSYFKGNIAKHNYDILHLITGHPEGLIISWNRKTDGSEDWHSLYNYPDYGVTFTYQNLKNEYLGENFGLYAHYNFYFLNRNLMWRIGQGLAYTTHPYDKEENYRNIAFGTQILSSTMMMLQYKKERIAGRWGGQAGLSLIHYSNANVKAPNTSVNSITVSVGLNYQLDAEPLERNLERMSNRLAERVRFNFVFRSGINESDIIDSGQYAFYVFSAYADKRINKKSAFQLGTDVFYSNFLKELIRYRSIAFPEDGLTGSEDYKRVGLFAGHELFINKLSVVTQFGYYVYYPYDFEGRTYLRAGLKRYFGDRIFGAITLKAHGAKAEAVELGIGIRI
ncbi:acyloxyacyl hydrolase [Robertkochia solimangrovi]|uniref:acyloxyacyl hydrolase n=1 Tax=Robertkochia solimangrovi TaxID=2213046 RepID=UPI00117DF758|nr:acyloxyacyl hydrolase [Robertkochia solimangrovi]TRZ44389.1 acyloxyacyl hydrolase [Robertkochia solimangrovi]